MQAEREDRGSRRSTGDQGDPASTSGTGGRSWRRLWLVATFLLVQTAAPAAEARVLDVGGDHGYEDVILRGLEPGSVIDARSARLHVANSRNTDPTADADCHSGPLRVNPYPFRLYASPSALLIGGTFDGEVPLASDWKHTYCNSAALSIFDSPRVVIEGVRMRRAWDGVRFSGNSGQFLLQRSWLSQVRDDCIENDFLNSGIIKDVLLDGCFSGMSVREPASRSTDASSRTVVLLGALIRVVPYVYRDENRLGLPIKASPAAPALQVIDSVLAMDGDGDWAKDGEDMISASQLKASWEKISDCRGNLFLWISDKPWPSKFARPPSCFRFVQGIEARSLWQKAHDNWIDCHAAIGRFPEDRAPDVLSCENMSYGGKYR